MFTMTNTVDLNRIAHDIGGEAKITLNSPENDLDRKARIQMEIWKFWTAQAWTLLVVLSIGALMVVVFGYVRDADTAIAQWARALVMSLVSAGIAFVAGRLTR